MATVKIQKYKGKNCTSYAVKYNDPFTRKTKHYKSCRRKRDAQQAANELRTLIDSGKFTEVKKNKKKLNLLTFSEVSELVIKEWKIKLIKGAIQPTTFGGYIERLDVVKKTFAKDLLCKISSTGIDDYRNRIKSENSAVTSNRCLFVIKQVFKCGLKVGAIRDDSASGVKYLSEKHQERNNYLLPEKYALLIEKSKEGRAKYYLPALISLGAEHGASKQEALSLKWYDINFEFDGQGLIHFFRTKNGNERTEYMMPNSKKALLEWQHHLIVARHRRKISKIKSDRVFCRLDGTPIANFNRAWWRARDAAGFDGFHFHDLRHTFCSNLLMSGANIKDVKDMIGHRDISMTDRYGHISTDHKRLQQNRLAEYYANGTKQLEDLKEGNDKL